MPVDDQVRFYEAKLQYEIDPWDLNAALGRGDKIYLVDTRSPEVYGRSHIPGAVNIPHRTMSMQLMDWSLCSLLVHAAVHSKRPSNHVAQAA